MAKDKICKPFVGIIAPDNKFTVDTIDDLKSRNYLKIGDVVELNGYYTAGDGAGHKRKIEATDDGSGVQLANGLWANIVHSGKICSSWFGAISGKDNAIRNNEFKMFIDFWRNKIDETRSAEQQGFWGIIDADVYLDREVVCLFDNHDYTMKSLVCQGGVINFKSKKGAEINGLIFRVYRDGLNTGVRNKTIKLKINGEYMKETLVFETRGHKSSAFYGSSLTETNVKILSGRCIVLRNGVFEFVLRDIVLENIRDRSAMTEYDVSLLLEHDGPDTLSNIISSLMVSNINIWGGIHAIKNTRVNGASYSCSVQGLDNIHIFDTGKEGVYLENIATSSFRNLHFEFIGGFGGNKYYAMFLNGRNAYIEAVEGGGSNLLGFLKCYLTRATLKGFRAYSMPNSTGYVFLQGPVYGGVIPSFETDATYTVEPYSEISVKFLRDTSTRTEHWVSGVVSDLQIEDTSGSYILFKNGNNYEGSGQTFGWENNVKAANISFVRCNGKKPNGVEDLEKTFNLGFWGGRTIFNADGHDFYERHEISNRSINGSLGYIAKLKSNISMNDIKILSGLNGQSDSTYNYINLPCATNRPIQLRGSVLGNKTLSYRIGNGEVATQSWIDLQVKTLQVTLDTPYYTLKMQQEGIYEDFIQYMDEKTEYDRLQREVENQTEGAMVLSAIEEPQPSEKLLAFKEKYLG